MDIKSLWSGYKFPECGNCKKDCGKYKCDNLCSNLNYLKNYGEEYFERMKESFEELAKITKKGVTVYSFGCGCSLDYLAGKQVFGENFSYFNIDECDWAIKETKAYKNLDNKMPKESLNFDEGINFLNIAVDNVAICFFNSLNDILNNKSDLKQILVASLKQKQNFYILCNYTHGGNHTLAWNEECFLKDLCKELKNIFLIKKLEILNGEGIIITGSKK